MDIQIEVAELKKLVLQSKSSQGRKAILKSDELDSILGTCRASLQSHATAATDSVLYSLQLARNLCISADFQATAKLLDLTFFKYRLSLRPWFQIC